MKRGDVVIAVFSGDLGKPRPAIIVQSDLFSQTGTVVVLPVTSELAGLDLFRLLVAPSPENGLLVPSHVMTDKITHLKREKIGQIIGQLSSETMQTVARQIAIFLSLP